MWVREREDRGPRGNGRPTSASLHLAFREVHAHPFDRDAIRYLGEQQDVGDEGFDEVVVARRSPAFEVPGRDPHAGSLA
jgi:hypothetical protein